MDPRDVQSIPLFAGLSKDDQKVDAQYADEVDVDTGTVLAREGKLAYEFFAIRDGAAEVTLDGRHAATLGPGDFFGEIGLLAVSAASPPWSRRARRPHRADGLAAARDRQPDARRGRAHPQRDGPASGGQSRRVRLASLQWVALATNARTRARGGLGGMGPFLFAAAAMFTAMYSTQAILPELGREFSVEPAQTGLTVSVVIGALAVGAWFWGPLSDRIGRRRSLVLASGALVVPSLGVALAPSFGVLLAMRAAQGLCMPGLLTVGVPYVTEAYAERIGARAMGLYVSALVLGGLVGRVGVALLTAATTWRVALGAVAALPLAATLVMRRSLPAEQAGPPRPDCPWARCGGCSPTARSWPHASPGPRCSSPSWGLLLHRLPPGAPAVLALAGGHRARLRAVGHGRRRAARGPAGRPSRLAGRRARRPAAVRRRVDALAGRSAARRGRRARAGDAGQLLGGDRCAARRRGLHRSRPRRRQRDVLQRLLRGRRARRLCARARVGAVALDRRLGDGDRGLRAGSRSARRHGHYPRPSVRSFACSTCGQLVFFENTVCLRCSSELGFDWERREVLTLDGGVARCANLEAAGCNWLVAREGELCASCRLTRTRPADDDATALEQFRVAEAAKRRLLFELGELGLPVQSWRERDGGLAFDLLSSEREPVTTGHADGVITLDLAESDDAHRERAARAARRALPHACSGTSATRSATTTGRCWCAERQRARALPRAVRRRARGLRRGARSPLRDRAAARLGAALRQRLRHDAPVGGLGRDLRPLPAHPGHAADRGRLRRARGRPDARPDPAPAATCPGPRVSTTGCR